MKTIALKQVEGGLILEVDYMPTAVFAESILGDQFPDSRNDHIVKALIRAANELAIVKPTEKCDISMYIFIKEKPVQEPDTVETPTLEGFTADTEIDL